MIQWTPRFLWDDGLVHDETLVLPVGLWRHSFPVVGGEIESDAGRPASYIVRRDYCLAVPVRYLEDEWPTIRALIAHGQSGGLIYWYPNADDTSTSYEVYLEAPELGDDVIPQPDGEYPRALSIVLVLRRTEGRTWDDLKFFEEAA